MSEQEQQAEDELTLFVAQQLNGRGVSEVFDRFGYAGLRLAGRMVFSGKLWITIPGYQLLVRQEAQTKNVREG